MTTRADRTGFTLLEVLLALGVTAALLVIVMGGLRVGLAAWQRGEERTAALDRERSLVVMLERSLAGAFPYRTPRDVATGPRPRWQADHDDGPAGEPRVVFDGRPDRLTFVTLAPPLPPGAPAAFSAVSLAADATGLALRQQILPNRLALDGMDPVLVDRQTTAVRFRYLGQEPEAWVETWDVRTEEALPRAVEVTLVTGVGARRAQQTLTVPIRAGTP